MNPLRDGELVLERSTSDSDLASLYDAIGEPAIWEHIPGGAPADAAALRERLLNRISRDGRISWLIVDQGQVVGTTSLVPVPDDPDGVEIGSTYLARRTWGTGLNGRVKRMVVRAAASAGAHWVRFRTDERNRRSVAAIMKLGARPCGARPDTWIRPDGTRRTSLFFRLDLDDPEVKCDDDR